MVKEIRNNKLTGYKLKSMGFNIICSKMTDVTWYKKAFPLRINRKDIGLMGVIRVVLPEGICRADVETYDGYPYVPYYIRDEHHNEMMLKVHKKLRYELNTLRK